MQLAGSTSIQVILVKPKFNLIFGLSMANDFSMLWLVVQIIAQLCLETVPINRQQLVGAGQRE